MPFAIMQKSVQKFVTGNSQKVIPYCIYSNVCIIMSKMHNTMHFWHNIYVSEKEKVYFYSINNGLVWIISLDIWVALKRAVVFFFCSFLFSSFFWLFGTFDMWNEHIYIIYRVTNESVYIILSCQGTEPAGELKYLLRYSLCCMPNSVALLWALIFCRDSKKPTSLQEPGIKLWLASSESRKGFCK